MLFAETSIHILLIYSYFSQWWYCGSCPAVWGTIQLPFIFPQLYITSSQYLGPGEPVTQKKSDFLVTFLDGAAPFNVVAKAELH
jgi:hypothetical protein